MFAALFWGLTASAGDVLTETAPASDAEQESSAPEAEPEKPTTAMSGEAREHLDNLVGIETQMKSLGANPNTATVVSAELDWGTMVSDKTHTFSRSGITVRQQRLTDGALLSVNKAVDEVGTYDLDDPEQRAKLCTRIRVGETQRLTLHAWTEDGDPTSGSSRSRAGAGFVMLNDEQGDRTALVDLEPGESATVVELVRVDRKGRRREVDRTMTLHRGERVMTLTEASEIQRICLEY